MSGDFDADTMRVMGWQRGAVALALGGGILAAVWLTNRTSSIAEAVWLAAPYLAASLVPLMCRRLRAFRSACLAGGMVTGMFAILLFFWSGFAFLHCAPILLLSAAKEGTTTLSLVRGILAWIIGIVTAIAWVPAILGLLL